MKKPVQVKDVVRTNEAAKARRAARIAKRSGRAAIASRTAQTTLAAAIGAGILLHGGHTAPLPSPPVALVVQDVAWTSSDDEDGSPEQDDNATDASTADTESTSDAESGPTEDADRTPENTKAPTAESAEPTSSDESAAVPADDPTSPTTSAPSTPEAVPVTTMPKAAAPTPVSTPAVTPSVPTPSAVIPLTGLPAAGGSGPGAPTRVVAPVVGTSADAAAIVTTARDVAGAARTASKARVTQAVAQNILARVALGLAGILPTTPGGGPVPTTPTAPTGALLIAQWALFRRGGHVFNQSPVSSPAQAPSSTGAVVGNLHAIDPDGDRLTYTVVTEPTHGRVTLGEDGAFTYTPDPEFARTGGSDAFTVVIRDNDPARPGAGRYTDLLRTALARHPVLATRLFGPHAISVTVPVTVAPTITTPPVPPAPVAERGTGAVTGRLDVPVTPGVPVELSVPQQPSAGAVTVQPNGTYTFTPNAAARRAAAGTPGSDVVKFTVLVADGQGGTTPVEVTAVVDPGPAEVVAEIPVGPGVQQLETSPDGRRVFAIGGGGSSGARTFSAMRMTTSDADLADDAADAPSAGSTIAIIDAGSNTLISTIALPGRVENLTFSPDGTHAFVTTRVEYGRHGFGSGPNTITVIDTTSDSVVATLEIQDAGRGIVYDHDGTRAYVSDYDADRIVVLDLRTNTTSTISVPRPQGLFFSPDGRRIYTPNINDGTTSVIDASTGSVIGSVPAYGEPRFGADDRYGYIVDYHDDHGAIAVVDTTDDSVTVIPTGGMPTNVWFGTGGAYAFVMDRSGPAPKVTVIDTADHSFTTIDIGDDPGWMYVSPDGTRTYVTDRASSSVTVIDSAHGVAVKTVQLRSGGLGYAGDLQFSPDGSRFYLVNGNTITVFNTTDDSVITIPGDGTLGFTPDGSHAYVLGHGDLSSSTLRLIDTSDDSVRTLEVPGYADRAYFNQDGSRAYLTSWSGTDLTVVDTVSGEVTPLHVGRQSYEPQFSPDGRQLFVVGYEYTEAPDRWVGLPGTVTVIDTTDDAVRTVPVGIYPSRMTFSPDGEHAYIVSDRSLDGSTITVIDRTDGTYTSFEGSPYATDVEFTPDGRYAYVFGYGETIDDGEIMFIDLADGATSVVPVPAPTGIRFSADGRSAYVLDARAGTATVIALDGAAPAAAASQV